MSTVHAAQTEGQPGSTLFGRTRQRVLGWLLTHTDQAFYLRQIVRHAGAAQGAVQRELNVLTHAGLLRRTVRGRQVYFQANEQSPVFHELRGLIVKTSGVADALREALAPLSGRVIAAFVFGSAARGQLQIGSDVDLIVVGDVSFSDVAIALAPAQERLGREVNPTVYPPGEFRSKVRRGHHFLTRVLSEPRLFVMGGPDELDRLGAKRMADRAPIQRSGSAGPPGRRRTRPPRQRR